MGQIKAQGLEGVGKVDSGTLWEYTLYFVSSGIVHKHSPEQIQIWKLFYKAWPGEIHLWVSSEEIYLR